MLEFKALDSAVSLLLFAAPGMFFIVRLGEVAEAKFVFVKRSDAVRLLALFAFRAPRSPAIGGEGTSYSSENV